MKLLKTLWGFVVWLFERADIIPPLIVVSVWHYAGALAKHDPPLVAGILGVLVDLGHYRAVKAFLKHLDFWRFVVMATFTVMTGYFHYLWYRDWLLAIAVPMLIIGLALLSRWERWEEGQAARFRVEVAKPAAPALNVPEVAGSLPEHAGGWRQMTAEQRAALGGMTAAQIAALYGVSERTARDWRRKAKGA